MQRVDDTPTENWSKKGRLISIFDRLRLWEPFHHPLPTHYHLPPAAGRLDLVRRPRIPDEGALHGRPPRCTASPFGYQRNRYRTERARYLTVTATDRESYSDNGRNCPPSTVPHTMIDAVSLCPSNDNLNQHYSKHG